MTGPYGPLALLETRGGPAAWTWAVELVRGDEEEEGGAPPEAPDAPPG